MLGYYKYIRLWFLLCVVVFFYACGKKSSCIKNAGKQTTEVRPISFNFSKIEVKDNINLVLIQDSLSIMKIEGGENLLPYVKAEVSNNMLSISNGNKCNFLRSYNNPITVYLSVTNIEEIYYTGKGSISNTDVLNLNDFIIDVKNGTGSVALTLNANKISVLSHTGSTDFTLLGTTNDLYVYTGSNAWLYLSNLLANKVHVNTSGTGDVFVTPLNELLIELTSLGNIHYSGSPALIISTHSGKGKIIKN